MQISSHLKNAYSAVKRAMKKPEGEGYSGTAATNFNASSLLNDTAIYIENGAEVALGMGSLLVGGSLARSGHAGLGAALVASSITDAFKVPGNLAGNLAAKVTGSEAVGRTTRALTKAGMFLGGVVALGGTLGVGAFVLAGATVAKGAMDLAFGADFKKGAKPAEKEAASQPPENLLSASAPSEFDAPNLLDSKAPSEFDAPDLLTRETDSRQSLAKLNSPTNPKVLIQTV